MIKHIFIPENAPDQCVLKVAFQFVLVLSGNFDHIKSFQIFGPETGARRGSKA